MPLLRVGDDAVDVAGRHAPVVLRDGVLEDRAQPVHALPGERGDLQDGCVTDEGQLARQLTEHPRRSSGSVISSLVEQHQDRTSGRVDALGKPLILTRHTLPRVDHQQRDVGVVDRPQRPDEVVLGSVIDPRPSPHAGRVDVDDRTIGRFDEVSMESRVVPGRSWTTERSSPTRRLNSVLLPTLGRPTIATLGGWLVGCPRRDVPPLRLALGSSSRSRRGQPLDDDVQQIARAARAGR